MLIIIPVPVVRRKYQIFLKYFESNKKFENDINTIFIECLDSFSLSEDSHSDGKTQVHFTPRQPGQIVESTQKTARLHRAHLNCKNLLI